MIKKVTRKAKKCPYCLSLKTIKKGKRKDIKKPITRYKCLGCNKWFQEERRKSEKDLIKEIFKKYFWNRKTLEELSNEYTLSPKTIQKYINNYQIEIKKKTHREIVLIIDVVFFNKRKFKSEFGIMIFYDAITQEPLLWKEVKNERLSDYKEMYFKIIEQGFKVKAVVIDGKKGLKEFFEKEKIIIQYCQFHQIKTILSYITKNPRLIPSIHLKLLISFLTEIAEKEFKESFKFFLKTFKDEINRKELNLETNKYYFIHKRLRSAIKSLINNLPYLFTYQKCPELNIPNTTNLLDGGEFSYLKRLLRNHNGISKELKLKMIDEYFENHHKRIKRKRTKK